MGFVKLMEGSRRGTRNRNPMIVRPHFLEDVMSIAALALFSIVFTVINVLAWQAVTDETFDK